MRSEVWSDVSVLCVALGCVLATYVYFLYFGEE